MRFTLRAPPDQRLDLSPLTPERLAGMDRGAIQRLPLNTTRAAACVGDLFSVANGDAARVVIEGGSVRFDNVGAGMSGGELLLDGEAGLYAGRTMSGGRLQIRGDVGPFAASGLRGGFIEIVGDAGERLGGAFPGERTGMAGGMVIVRGNAGERAGDRLRRGTIVVEGDAGAAPASRMIAGTLVICGVAGRLPGYLMRRGTLVLGRISVSLSPTFIPIGGNGLLFFRLLAGALDALSPRAAGLLRGAAQRYAGDMAVLGKGEIVVADR